MQVKRKKEAVLFEDMVNIDGFDTQFGVQLVIDYEHGGFKVKPNLLSKHGYSSEVRDVMDQLCAAAFEMGEEKMAQYRQENGIGDQGDLFASSDNGKKPRKSKADLVGEPASS